MNYSAMLNRLACIVAFFVSALFSKASQDTILIFNEVMYHPLAGEPEWIELRNLNGVDVDISDWTLEGAVDYTFPVGTVVLGNSYLLVTSDVSNLPEAMGPYSGQLADEGEEIRLVNNSDRVMSILDYNDRGDWPIAADGSGASLAKIEIDTLASDPSSWRWSDQSGGTPGTDNFPNGYKVSGLVFNEHSGVTGDNFSIELGLDPNINQDQAIDLEGHLIQSSTGGEYTFAATTIEPGTWLSINKDTLAFDTIADGDQLRLIDPDGKVLDAVRLTRSGRARHPDFSGPWLRPETVTPMAANEVNLSDAIVINEIMYHHRPQYDGEVEGQPYLKNPQEWLELHNRSDAPVSLAGWSLDGGIRFEFSDDLTITPGGYLVVSNEADALRVLYPAATIVGDFRGELNNHTDHVLLLDANGNPADEVTYFDGGNWPGNADAGGSSLELTNPNSDNSMAGSWAASDESLKSDWKQYTYRGEATKPPGTNFPTRWNELVVGLLDRGEFLIDDMSVVEDPDGAANKLLRNGSFNKSIFGGDGSQNWRFLGNHGGHGKTVIVSDPSDEANTVLHVVASSATEHMHNHLETTFSGSSKVSAGTTYEITYRAKWLSGSPQLNTRLYFNWLAKTTILDIPKLHGTPGAANSTFADNVGPAYASLSSQPAIAKDSEPIKVHVEATDPDGLASLVVKWKLDGQDEFQSVPMEVVSGNRYEGNIPAQKTQNLFGAYTEGMIQFYIEGTDMVGATTWYPSEGPESRAMIPFEDGRESAGPGHNVRIVLPAADAEFLHEVTNVMSNHRMPCTVIYKETEAFYNVGVRLKGSQRGRNQDVRKGFSLKMPSDNRFRGLHGTIAVDRSGSGNEFSQKEILVKHAINRAGDIPGMYDDLIHVVAPKISPQDRHTGSAMLLMARYDAEYLNGIFENGTDGRMFEYELIYYPTSSEGGAEGLKRPEPDSVVGVPHRDLGDDKETYRWHYLTENNRDADDYAGIMEVLKTLGMPAGDDYFARLDQLFDTDQWLRSFAIQILFGISDAYPSGSQHNMVIYIHPEGKSMFFPWDMDFTFRQGATSAINQHPDLRKMMMNPLIERSYYAQVYELLQTVFNADYMDRWADHYVTFLPGQNFNSFKTYINTRSKSAESQLRSRFEKVPFAITSMNGADFEVSASTVTLEGMGWVDIATIQVNDREYEPVWIDRDRWQLTVPLVQGENKLELQAVDITGSTGSLFSPLGSGSITVTNQGGIEAANADNLIVSEIMYHPATPSESEIAAGFTNDDDFEFVEIQNIGPNQIDLAGVRFTNGIDFDFTAGTMLAAGEFMVLVANEEAFKQRYGDAIPITGVYNNRLRNSGESIRLRAVDDSIIKEFAFNDAEPWPLMADGEGVSLTLNNAATNPDPNVPASWSASAQIGGSPGTGETTPEPDAAYEAWLAERGGDGQADPDGDGFPLLLEFALGADLAAQPVSNLLPTVVSLDVDGQLTPSLQYRKRDGSSIRVEVEESDDLNTWQSAQGKLVTVSESANGDGTSTITVRPNATVASAYYRIKVTP